MRHTGAINALALYDESYPWKMAPNARVPVADYIKESAIAPLSGCQDLLAVRLFLEIARSSISLQVKLGGTGLRLVALPAIEKSVPGTTPFSH